MKRMYVSLSLIFLSLCTVFAQSITIDNVAQYASTDYYVGGKMDVSFSWDAGDGQVIDADGVKVRLRHLEAWGLIADVDLVVVTDAVGTQTGSTTVTLDLATAVATDSLAADNWHWLWVQAKNDAGTNIQHTAGNRNNVDKKINIYQTPVAPGVMIVDQDLYKDMEFAKGDSIKNIKTTYFAGNGGAKCNYVSYSIRLMPAGTDIGAVYDNPGDSLGISMTSGIKIPDDAVASADLPADSHYELFAYGELEAAGGTKSWLGGGVPITIVGTVTNDPYVKIENRAAFENMQYILGDTIREVSVSYNAGTGSKCNYLSYSIRILPDNADSSVVYVNPGDEMGTAAAQKVAVSKLMKLTSELADGQSYALYVFGEMEAGDGTKSYISDQIPIEIVNEIKPVGLFFSNGANYNDSVYVSGDKMKVSVDFNMGPGKVVDADGIKFWLRRLGGTVVDVKVADKSVVGQTEGTAMAELDLFGVTPTADLPTGEWYWLWVTHGPSNDPAVNTTWAQSIQIEPMAASIVYDDNAKYKAPNTFESGSMMSVTTAFEMGDGDTVSADLNGITYRLREMTSDWSTVVNDYVATDESAIGMKNGVSTAEIDLTGAIATEDLPDGNFYFLFAQTKSKNGQNINKGLNPVQITRAPNSVVKYEVYNTTDNSMIMELKEGSRINIATIGKSFNIRAVTMPDPFGAGIKCKMELGGDTAHVQTEGVAPYALFGDDSGTYLPHNWTPGSYSLNAYPVLASDGSMDGIAYKVDFTVVYDEGQIPEDIDRSGWTVIAVNSQAPANADKEFAIDGDLTTKWFSDWTDDTQVFPFNIDIDMGANVSIAEFTYVPRQDQWGPNGTAVDYDFYVSSSTSDWGTPAASGSFDYPEWVDGGDKEPFKESKTISLVKRKTGRFIRFVAKSAINEFQQVGVTELYVKGVVQPSEVKMIVEAEDTISATGDTNGQTEGVANGDPIGIYSNATASNGKAINFMNNDDKVEYKLNVDVEGDYTVTYFAGTTTGDPNAELSIDGVVVSNTPIFSNGAWDQFDPNVSETIVTLTAGTHTLHVRGNGSAWQFNLDKIEFDLAGANVPVTELVVEQKDIQLIEDETAQLSVMVKPSHATDKSVTWSAEDAAIASVDDAGLVTAMAAGMTYIYATTNDGSDLMDSVMVTVAAKTAVESVMVSPKGLLVVVSEMKPLTATVMPENATDKMVMWSSSDETIATVNDNGEVTGVAIGQVTITATTNDGAKTDTSVVTVIESAMTDMVDCAQLPSSVQSEITYTVQIPYVVNEKRDIAIEFRLKEGDEWMGEGRTTVEAGAGIATVEIMIWNDNTPILPPAEGDGYIFRAAVREVNGSWLTNKFVCDADVSVGGTGVSDVEMGALTIYPNPSSDVVNISGLDNGNYNITVYNLQGRKVMTTTKASDKVISLNVASLTSGYYFVAIEGEGVSYVDKINVK